MRSLDTTRQVTSDPSTSIVSEQSTSAGDRRVEVLSRLTDATEHTVRVLATNANGDSNPSDESPARRNHCRARPRSLSITMKNGRLATQAVCPVCSTRMFRIGKAS